MGISNINQEWYFVVLHFGTSTIIKHEGYRGLISNQNDWTTHQEVAPFTHSINISSCFLLHSNILSRTEEPAKACT